jgi:hypothetical protein
VAMCAVLWFSKVRSKRETKKDTKTHTFGQISFDCPKEFVVDNWLEGQYNVVDKNTVRNVFCLERDVPANVGHAPEQLLRYYRGWMQRKNNRVLASRVEGHKNGFEYVFFEYETNEGQDLLKGWKLMIPTPDGKVIEFNTLAYPPLSPWSEAEPIFRKVVDSIRIRE